MIITPIESGHKIQLPVEWAMELGLEKIAALEKTAIGVLVRPYRLTWDEVFANKISIGQQSSAADLLEVSGDDLLF